ncbi:MAG: SAM-dependent methyltransferase [Frankiales bacterium]|nr:SAM-dependent methyltransferase [Frankiales bacterium]
MVRHPAGLAAEGRQGQVQALTPEQVRALLSAPGRAAVAAAQQLDLSPSGRLRSAEAVRRAYGPELGPLALEQALLRERARAKHPRGDELWWTGPALEQASSYVVARHRARRFDGPVLDLCCSVGGDLLALPAGSTGVDLDEARLLLARANAEVLGVDVSLVRADVTALPLPPGSDVFVDPARRAGGRRVFDPRAYSPPLDVVLAWRGRVRSLGAKVAPGVDHDALPDDVEVELVSLHGDVKEAVLWTGASRRGHARSATLLPAGDVLLDDPVPAVQVRPPGTWLMEPDGAVVRAHLVAQAAHQVGGWLLDETIAYVSADARVPTPYGRWFEVLEVMPFGLKPLRERLRAHDAGPLVVKKRGTAVEPDVLRKQLKLTGSREVTIVLTRVAGRQVAMVVRPDRPDVDRPDVDRP